MENINGYFEDIIPLVEDVLLNNEYSVYYTEDGEPMDWLIEFSMDCSEIVYKYRDNICNKLLIMTKDTRSIYAIRLLKRIDEVVKLSCIPGLNQDMESIISSFYSELVEMFNDFGIDLLKTLEEIRLDFPGCCISVDWGHSQNNCKIVIPRKHIEFKGLFLKQHRDKISQFTENLERHKITNRGKLNSGINKNYLAKLMLFLGDKGILYYKDITPAAKVFYMQFGMIVRGDNDPVIDNSVTSRAIRAVSNNGINGLSRNEKDDFALICSCFI